MGETNARGRVEVTHEDVHAGERGTRARCLPEPWMCDVFHLDGSLRDIRVLDTTRVEWIAVLERLRAVADETEVEHPYPRLDPVRPAFADLFRVWADEPEGQGTSFAFRARFGTVWFFALPCAWRLTSRVTRPADLRFFPGQRRRPFSTLRDVESRRTRERPLRMSLPVDVLGSEALGLLSRFRVEFYECLYQRADALFELTDAVLCADGPVKTLVELSLAVEHRRGHGAMYAALDRGWLEPARLRRVLSGLPLPRAADGRIVLAVDVSHWLRPDAPTSDQRLFCHVYGRGDRSSDQFVPGWPYSFVAALETGRTSWVALLDAVRLGPADDATQVTARQLRDVVARLIAAGHWRPGDAEILIVMDSGYDTAYLTHALADLPVVLVGRLRSDRVMLRDAGPARSGPRGGRPRRHGGVLTLAKPDTWHTPDLTTTTDTSRYGTAEARAWDRMHPRLTHRGPWLDHAHEELPILHGTLIRLEVDHLPGDRDPKPVWLWSSANSATPADIDRWWQSFLRRFDLEHTFRLMKQTLGWTAPKIRHADTADLWTWLVIAAHTQLRLARPLTEDLRRPWERRTEPRRLTPARVRRGFRNVRAAASRPATAPKPSRPGPGRPPGSRNKQRARHHDVGKTVKRAESIKEHRRHQR